MEIGNRLPLNDCFGPDDIVATGEKSHDHLHTERAQPFGHSRRPLMHIDRDHQHPDSVPTDLWRYCNSSVTIPAH
jgi:hypothetical protein